MERARAAGAVGIIVTTDWSFSHGRDWGSPVIPEEMNLRTTVRMMPEGMTRPSWLLQWAKTDAPAEPARTQPGQRRRSRPAVLRRLRRVDGHAAADVGGHRLAASSCGAVR